MAFLPVRMNKLRATGGMTMKKRTRLDTALSLLKGLMAAIALTLAAMVGIAALAVYAGISNDTIRLLNQVLKGLAILLGAWAAIGRGGSRGFITGMALAMLYMALGYVVAVALGGADFAVPDMLGEILVGAAIGAVCGAVLSNLPAPRRRASAA